MYHEKAILGCYLFVAVGGVYFDANIILYEQALSLGDNRYLILKSPVFSVQFCTPHCCMEHISANTRFFVIICNSMDVC